MLTTKKQTQSIPFRDKQTPELIPADLSSFLNSCKKEIGLDLEDFESIFQDIIDRVVDGTDDFLPSRDLKIQFKFLQKLTLLFKEMIRID